MFRDDLSEIKLDFKNRAELQSTFIGPELKLRYRQQTLQPVSPLTAFDGDTQFWVRILLMAHLNY